MSIPWFLPELGSQEEIRVVSVLQSNYINDGDVTREFENEMAAFLNVNHCVAVTSGTLAISLALMALDIGFGDEVIVPDLTFIATANAVRLTGATVKLVDVDSRRFTIDPDRVEAAVTKRTKAIVPVDVNGRGADYEALLDICSANDLALVCDSAEALGSKYGGKYLGTIGDAGCFSFSPNKTVTCGQGGMIATNRTDLYHRLLELKDQGRRKQGTGGDDLHPVMGYNFKLTNLQAAVGLAQLERLKERLEKFFLRDTLYERYLDGIAHVEIPPWNRSEGEIKQWMDVLVDNRAEILSALTERGIGHRAFWYPLHTQAPYQQDDKPFPNSMEISRRGLWLPSHFSLSESDIQSASRVLKATVNL